MPSSNQTHSGKPLGRPIRFRGLLERLVLTPSISSLRTPAQPFVPPRVGRGIRERGRAVAVRWLANVWARYLATLRVAMYLAFAASASFLVTARVARGAMGEASLSVGRQLDAIRDLLGTTKTAVVNGQRVFVSTALVPLDVKTVLDRFERQCRDRPNSLMRTIERELAIDGLVSATPAQAAPATQADAVGAIARNLRARLGILREEDATDGIVVCLVQAGTGERTPLELARELARTRDVGLLGDFFHSYAVKTKAGESHVVTTWTRGSFKPGDMFPAEGDAPGSDSALAARPRNSRRVLSGVSVDAPYAIRVYESRDDAATLGRVFEGDMLSRRFARVGGADGVSQAYLHDSGIQVVATMARGDGRTIVSITEMGAANTRLVRTADSEH